jgi:hypothetical protein
MLSWIVILSLANWRIVSLLHMESMFDWLRKWMKIEQTIENDPHTWVYPDNLVGNLQSTLLLLVSIPLDKLDSYNNCLYHFTPNCGRMDMDVVVYSYRDNHYREMDREV